MRKVELSWTWATESPLHCGGGLSRPGVADRLIQRMSDGRPFIPGDAVKGALRMSAEQIAAWLDRETQYEDREPVEPTKLALALVFGGNADAHFTAATPNQQADSPSAFVFASTKIDSDSGTADDQMLRKTEALNPGCQFDARVTVHFDDSLDGKQVDAAVTLLAAALAATEHVGAKGGIGWGRVGVRAPKCSIAGEAASFESLLTPARLDGLRNMLRDPASAPVPAVHRDVATMERSASRWVRLEIRLDEPACFPRGPEVTHKISTLEHIRATALRGAMMRHWRRRGVGIEQALLWVDESSKWTPALPFTGGALVVPAPRSLHVMKRHGRGVHDSLLGPPPRIDRDGQLLQWKSVGEAWIASDTGDLRASEVRKQARMHVARDYASGSKREGALFTRESLVPDAGSEPLTFHAWACVGADAFEDGETFDLYLGKRTSAGYGQALVSVHGCGDGPPFEKMCGDNSAEDSVVVQLVAPALVRGAGGNPLRSLSVEWWEQFLGMPGALDRARSVVATGTRAEGGWMAPWGHLRASVTTIAAGSVWKLNVREREEAATVRSRLQARGYQLGERAHEGFGWFVVDPRWIGVPRDLAIQPSQAPRSDRPPSQWPGAPDTDIARSIAAEVEAIDQAALPARARSVLQELAQQLRAADDESSSRARLLCDARSKDARERSPWVFLQAGTAPRRLLDRFWMEQGDPRATRFAVEALLIRAGRGDR